MNSHPRIQREAKTLRAMFRMYCRHRHGSPTELCESCREMEAYALERLAHCPFQERKTTCAKCPIHCYRTEMRERVRKVMRYTGPRMLYAHPWLAICHMWDGIRAEPLPKKKTLKQGNDYIQNSHK